MKAVTRSVWISHGFWNVLEHGLSRGMDAISTLLILWSVPTEVFSQLALAQAYVAPALFFFIAPETALYREFSTWMAEGKGAMLRRLRVFRYFAWAKAGLAVGLALGIAALFPSPTGTGFGFEDRFYALIWAFLMPLLPQITGPDREFLRLNLDLRLLNVLTFCQRALYLILLAISVRFFPNSFGKIAACGAITAFGTAIAARMVVEGKFKGVHPVPVPEGSVKNMLWHTMRGFSLWNHVAGIVIGWQQTLDLFFLGWFRAPAAEIGIYGVALKLANFTLSVPVAIANLYQVYLGRQSAGHSSRGEVRRLVRLSLGLAVFSAVQAAVLLALAPWLLDLFSRGRWSTAETERMLRWLYFIVPACAIYTSTLLWSGWLAIRTSFPRLVCRVYLPWAAGGMILYGSAAALGGVDDVARMNVAVMGLFIFLLSVSALFPKKTGSSESSSI